tara:strand:- start:3961 stop:4959 length:999 start_codon:yes stop_codon:yes gene_type:complete
MAFLNNSGDIILDAVLTDAGRQRMARGEFKIVKFAFSDEEINYQLYESNHASGSAFADLEIMQTPILEAFTNNTSLMKTKLISLSRNNILYLPIFRLNNKLKIFTATQGGEDNHDSGYYLTADKATTDVVNFNKSQGYFPGSDITTTIGEAMSRYIYIDQGLETGGEPPITEDMPDDLIETAFLVRVDHRLLRLHGSDGVVEYPALRHSFVDDDAIATYYISSTNVAVEGPRDVTGNTPGEIDTTKKAKEMFNGPLGNRLRLMVQPSPNVKQSTALFTELGSDGGAHTTIGITPNDGESIANHKFIDTLVNVVGVTTGYSIDIPIRIIKKID